MLTCAHSITRVILPAFAPFTDSYYAPYLEDADDVLAEVAQWVIVMTLISALLIVLGIGANSDGEFAIVGSSFLYCFLIRYLTRPIQNASQVGMVFIFLQLICMATVLVLVLSDTVKEKEYIKSQVSEAANAGRRLRQRMTMRKKAAVPIMVVIKLQALARGAGARRQAKQDIELQGKGQTSMSIHMERADLESKTDGPRRSFKDITEATEQHRTGRTIGGAGALVGVPNKRPSISTRPQPFALGYDREGPKPRISGTAL